MIRYKNGEIKLSLSQENYLCGSILLAKTDSSTGYESVNQRATEFYLEQILSF